MHPPVLTRSQTHDVRPQSPSPPALLFLCQLGLCWGRGHSCGQEALSTSHGYHLFCALLTGFLFASHLPERLAPGRFDYIGERRPGLAREGSGRQLPRALSELSSVPGKALRLTAKPRMPGAVNSSSLIVADNSGNLKKPWVSYSQF